MVKGRQVACPVSPRWTVGGTPGQSVTVNGSVGRPDPHILAPATELLCHARQRSRSGRQKAIESPSWFLFEASRRPGDQRIRTLLFRRRTRWVCHDRLIRNSADRRPIPLGGGQPDATERNADRTQQNIAD